MRRALLLVALGASACASVPPAGVPLTGRWGGDHVGLDLTPSGGTLDYDCAAGRIDGPVLPRADGTFQAVGTHTPGTGGPEREGVVPPSYAARYDGLGSGRPDDPAGASRDRRPGGTVHAPPRRRADADALPVS